MRKTADGTVGLSLFCHHWEMEHLDHELGHALANSVIRGALVALLHTPNYEPGQLEIARNVCGLAELMKAVACGNLILSFMLRSGVKNLDGQSADPTALLLPQL